MVTRPSHSLLYSALVLSASLNTLADSKCYPDTVAIAKPTQPASVVIKDIEIINNTIFEDDEKAIWLHRIANKLHIKTQPQVIKSRLSFVQGQAVTLNDLQESERLLRSQRYLRDAQLSLATDCNQQPNGKVLVNTWDHWTLYPKINFSRSGGENTYSYGLKDDNLLGLGIRSNFKYFSDEDRSGFGVRLMAPITGLKHTNTSLTAFNNDDGYRYGLSAGKLFYTFDTKTSHYFKSEHHKQDLHIYQNGDEENVIELKRKAFEMAMGWSDGKQNGWTRRLSIGITSDEKSFAPTADQDAHTLAVPEDRRFIYPWLQLQVIEDNFNVIPDVHLISIKEDHLLGWKHTARLGFEARGQATNKLAGHFHSTSSKGYLNGKHLLFGSFKSTVDFGVADQDFYKASTGIEYFYNWRPTTKLFAKTEITLSENNYIDQPITLGGDLDDDDYNLDFITIAEPTVRGYPSQYQHGNKRWQSSVEIRHYPGIELYRLVRVAWVGFADAGRAWGASGSLSENEVSENLASIGVGLRLASIRSSGNNIIHLDVAKPLTSGDYVDSWEIRMQVKNKF